MIRVLVPLRLPLLVVVGLVMLPAATAAAETTTDDDATALTLLSRAEQASFSLGYEGTEVISTWTPAGTTTRMLDVRQVRGGSKWLTVRETGSAQESTMVWQAHSGESGPEDPLGPLTLLSHAYQVKLGGTGVVAGREATVVVVHRGSRVAAKMWLDDSTGLLLRQEVMDGAGRLIRAASFVDVRPTGTPLVPRQRTAGSSTPGTGTERTRSVPASDTDRTEAEDSAGRSDRSTSESRLRGTGLSLVAELRAASSENTIEQTASETARSWGVDLPDALPGGFSLLKVRQLDPDLTPGTGIAVQGTYSDGLSALSVFRQPGRLGGAVPELREQNWGGSPVYVGGEWPVRVVWQGGDTVLTVVSDAPLEGIRAAVEALPHDDPGADNILARIGEGMADIVVELVPGI
ncbi:MAG: sigma-E factor negative regulatory protein RseB [Actinomycetota bacterium]|nr:sigma-E factor negative regulatory protein RseB [Actinomycetota bacterium]